MLPRAVEIPFFMSPSLQRLSRLSVGPSVFSSSICSHAPLVDFVRSRNPSQRAEQRRRRDLDRRMTTYGTIPTSSGEGDVPLGFISRAKERGRSALATRRPWREMAHRHAFSFPPSLGEAYLRIRTNAAYFAMNYAIVVLFVVFISLLWHPVSLIVFIIMMAAWLFLYFLRDEPLVIFRRQIGDRVVLIILSVVTLVVLLVAGATLNIVISLLVGLLLVVAHAALRRTDDLALDEEGAGPGGWYSVAAGDSRPPN